MNYLFLLNQLNYISYLIFYGLYSHKSAFKQLNDINMNI